MQLSGGNTSTGLSVKVIEDLPPLYEVKVTLKVPATSARLVPPGGNVAFKKSGDRVTLQVPAFSCHQMIELRG